MGATSSKPAVDANGQPIAQQNRGCASWSNWNNKDDETKQKAAAGGSDNKAATPSSSIASKPAETQTEMLIRLKEIPENEGVWYLAFERLAGDAKSALPIDSAVTAVTNVPIDDGKGGSVRLPTQDEARATVAAVIDNAPAVTAKLWVKLFLVITSGWSTQRIDISAKAASKKIGRHEAVTAVEGTFGQRKASDAKEAKTPSGEKVGQSSTVPEEESSEQSLSPVDVVSAATNGAKDIQAPVASIEVAPVAVTHAAPEPVAPAIEKTSPPSPSNDVIVASEGVVPSEPSPVAKSDQIEAKHDADLAAHGGGEEPTVTPIDIHEFHEDAAPRSPEVKTPETPSGGTTPGGGKKKGKGKPAAAPTTPKTPTPPSQPPPPVKTQGSQKNLNASTPKGAAPKGKGKKK